MTDNEIANYKYEDDVGIDIATFDKEAEIAKFKNEIPVGWSILVRLYTTPQKVGSILMVDKTREEDLYRSCVGLVVGISEGAYKDIRYEHTGPWCDVGDWIVFPRHAGFRIFIRGTPIWVIKEDAPCIRTLDPVGISNYKY